MKLRSNVRTFLVLVLLAAVQAASAQIVKNNNYTPDQTLKSNARVNPSTLAMELSIPLGGYPGRGGASFPFNFDYTSKVWQMRYSGLTFAGNDSKITEVTAQYARRTAAGWTSSLGTPRIDFHYDVYRGEDWDSGYEGMTVDQAELPPGTNFPLYIIRRLRVNLPDGSSHEVRESDLPVQCGDTSGNFCAYPDFSGTYLAVDGSRLRLEVASNSAVLLMPDGGRYVFGGQQQQAGSVDRESFATAYIDASGNKATYDLTGRRWTDTLGRVLVDPLPANTGFTQDQTGGDQNVDLPWFNGGTTRVVLSWRPLKDPNGGESGLGDPNLDLWHVSDRYCTPNSSSPITGDPLFWQTGESGTRVCAYDTAAFNPVVLTKITLPNRQSYRFEYNVYGEIEKVTYPTGGYERFVYGQIPAVQESTPAYDQTNRGVKHRYVSAKGDGSDEVHWSYEATRGTVLSPQPYQVTVTAPDLSRTEQLIFDEPRNANSVYGNPKPYGFDGAKTGRPYETRAFSTSGQPLSRRLTVYEMTTIAGGVSGHVPVTRDLRPVKEISIAFEPGDTAHALASMSETVYDTTGSSDAAYFSSLNAKQAKVYDYAVAGYTAAQNADATAAANWFSSVAPAKTVETDYLYNANYKARNISGLAVETRIKDATGTVRAKSQIGYDGLALLDEDESARWENPNTVYRGLVTSTKSYYDVAAGQYVETKAQYDLMGNLRYAWDGRNNVTESVYSAAYDHAYRTSVISPVPDTSGTHGANDPLVTTTDYDYNTGLPTLATDPNGLSVETTYDSMLRPVSVTTKQGTTVIGSVTETSYGTPDQSGVLPAGERFVKVRTQIDASHWKEGYTWFDGLGRTVRTQAVDGAGDVSVLTCYDQMGRVEKVTNPFRGYTDRSCSNPAGLEWTSTSYDTAGRVASVTTPDTAHVDTAYSLAAFGGQIGTVVTVTDQAGKLRRSITNALGQLIRVDEPNGNNQLGNIDGPNQPTLYGYDVLNNLTSVQQDGDTAAECGGVISTCSQTRLFVYDAMSRLKQATNPESGTILYTYDDNSNLRTKTDARGIQTTYTYDPLNRVTHRTYAAPSPTPQNYQATPDVDYYYDNVANARGKLVKVSSAVSTTEYTSFDILGRVTAHKQTTNGQEYTTAYGYNLAGALIEETYPSGRVVKNVLDGNGDLSVVKSKKDANHLYWNYAQNFTYNAAGAVTSMQLGNGRWESTVFNSRLQPTQIALGTTVGAFDLLKLNYDYGDWAVDGTVNTAKNNGNIVQQTIAVPNSPGHPDAFQAVQKYYYDPLNRIDDAAEDVTPSGGTASRSWRQDFSYDRYGNRGLVETNTTTIPRNCGTAPAFMVCTADRRKFNPAVDVSKNRLSTSEGYSFDAAGNTIGDAETRAFIYDGENKQVEVRDAAVTPPPNDPDANLVGRYWYDGDGKRVKKFIPSSQSSQGETIIFVYDASGREIAEYSTDVAVGSDAVVAYPTNDHLGSPRIITDASGSVTSRHDYHPFGEEIKTARTQSDFVGDSVRKQFTGYERDGETDLDFAQARYFSFGVGRFSSPDPTMLSVTGQNPQTWNRYVYVTNRPLSYTDPLGLWGMLVTAFCKMKNDVCEVDKKGRTIIDHVTISFYKTKDDDDGASLAKQLGLQGDEAKSFAKEVDDFTGKDTAYYYPQDSDNDNVRGAFNFVAGSLRSQIRRDTKGEKPREDANCAGTACQLGLRDLMQPSLVAPEDFDKILKSRFTETTEEKLKLRDVIRYATDGGKTPQHFTSFLFRNDDGVPIVFSKSGTKGRYEIGTARSFEVPIYGKMSGFYTKP